MKKVKTHFRWRLMIVFAAVAAIPIGANGERVPSLGDGSGCTTVAPPGTAQLLVTPVLPPLGEEPYLPGTVIVGQEIRLPADADVVWFEIHFQNWQYPAGRGGEVVEEGAGAKPGEYEPVSPEGDVSQNSGACCTPTGCVDNVDDEGDCSDTHGGYKYCPNTPCTQCSCLACCTPTGCVYALHWDDCHNNYQGYTDCPNKPFTQCSCCSNPEVPVVTGTPEEGEQPVLAKTRALPSPPCIGCMGGWIDHEEPCKLLEGGTVSPPLGEPGQLVVIDYEYSHAVPGAIDYGHIAYIATLRMELEGFGGDRSSSFLVELDPTETFIRDQYGRPIPCTMVPAVVIIEGGGAIPTVSEWGLVILALLLLVAAKGYFGRRAAKRV